MDLAIRDPRRVVGSWGTGYKKILKLSFLLKLHDLTEFLKTSIEENTLLVKNLKNLII